MKDYQLMAVIAELWGVTGVCMFAFGHLYTALFCIAIAILQGYKSAHERSLV